MSSAGKRMKHTLLLLVSVATAILPSCAADTPSSPGTPRSVPEIEIAVYQGADTLGADQVRFTEVLGQGRPVVLVMYARLCPVCRRELADLQEMHLEHGDRVAFVGLDVGPFVGLGSEEDGQALLQDLGITFAAGTTRDPEVMRFYGVIGVPYVFFITPNERIVQTAIGYTAKDRMTQNSEELLRASSGS